VTSRSDARAVRLASLLLRPNVAPVSAVDVAGVVTWFGAMQAQDLGSGLWSFGTRLPDRTVDDVNAALERREALRTWPMRGTVHFVPSEDAHWMLDLLGSRALAGAAKRRAFLGLSDRDADRAADILGAALTGGRRMTRAECLQTLRDAGVDPAGQLGYHLLWYASQRGVTCIAPSVGTEQTFVLLDEWVPTPNRLARDEALATITTRYFRSHGPATRKDFAGWTGLPMSEVKAGLALSAAHIVRVDVDGQEMYVAQEVLDHALSAPQAPGQSWHALPGFDEYLLGYKERSLFLEPEQLNAVIPGGNGVFRSTLVRDGRVVATWTKTNRAAKTSITVHPLAALSARDRTRINGVLAPYGRFLQRPIEVTIDPASD
jgi:hypothetical protein